MKLALLLSALALAANASGGLKPRVTPSPTPAPPTPQPTEAEGPDSSDEDAPSAIVAGPEAMAYVPDHKLQAGTMTYGLPRNWDILYGAKKVDRIKPKGEEGDCTCKHACGDASPPSNAAGTWCWVWETCKEAFEEVKGGWRTWHKI